MAGPGLELALQPSEIALRADQLPQVRLEVVRTKADRAIYHRQMQAHHYLGAGSMAGAQGKSRNDPIVAGKGLIRLERRGSTVSEQRSKEEGIRLAMPITELMPHWKSKQSQRRMLTGEPDAGNLHVRFDEGE